MLIPTLRLVFTQALLCPACQRPQVMIPHLRGAAASETRPVAFRNSVEWVSPPLTTGILPLSRAAHLDHHPRVFALDYGRSCKVSRASRTLFLTLFRYYNCDCLRHPPFLTYFLLSRFRCIACAWLLYDRRSRMYCPCFLIGAAHGLRRCVLALCKLLSNSQTP